MVPFENLKLKRQEEQMSVEQLVDRYADNYYVSIDYRNNGTINIWIGAKKHDICNDCLNTMKTECE